MLYRILEANNMTLPSDNYVIFCNTGKEHEATLEFVKQCQDQWNIPITWLEYAKNDQKFKEVTFETASRNGEPFEQMI
jgi:3'-phosphoadenosine 5'-phosphosulfate sulfotransferase (PAPS reductase)/FAD synthetase